MIHDSYKEASVTLCLVESNGCALQGQAETFVLQRSCFHLDGRQWFLLIRATRKARYQLTKCWPAYLLDDPGAQHVKDQAPLKYMMAALGADKESGFSPEVSWQI